MSDSERSQQHAPVANLERWEDIRRVDITGLEGERGFGAGTQFASNRHG